MNETFWSTVSQAEVPMLVAPLLNPVDVDALDVEINSPFTFIEKMLAAASAADHFVDAGIAIAAGNDDGFVAECDTH